MSDKQDTTEDIIREMREFGERCDRRPFSWQMVDGLFKRLADRIEAAVERERDPLAKPRLCKSCKHLLPEGCEICGCSDYVEAAAQRDQAQGPSSSTKLGNAAALKEAKRLEAEVDRALKPAKDDRQEELPL